MMRCAGCGVEAPALKTVLCRADRERRGVLCDSCWLPLRDRLWGIPGPVACFGRCSGCGGWFSVRELADLKPGGARKGDAPGGTCVACVKEG